MDKSKEASAREALKFVEKGMLVGLGTGSTAEIFIAMLGKMNRAEKLGLTCIATSKASEAQAKRLGLKLSGFGKIAKLDFAFDGADQVDGQGRLIKGLGGALVREKIVDYRANKFVVMVGKNKLVEGLSGIVPVEVIPLAEEAVRRELGALGAVAAHTRKDGKKKFISDNGNSILHAEFGRIDDPLRLEDEINKIPGVVDNGIFARKKAIVSVGHEDGTAGVI
jgi:ribose 5-phosphate isomerase A